MIVDEEEARNRYCPMALANAGFATHAGDQNCRASACMAWVAKPERKRLFVKMPNGIEEEYDWDPRTTERGKTQFYAHSSYREVVERLGSCGLCERT